MSRRIDQRVQKRYEEGGKSERAVLDYEGEKVEICEGESATEAVLKAQAMKVCFE